jgi:hypothetical protein
MYSPRRCGPSFKKFAILKDLSSEMDQKKVISYKYFVVFTKGRGAEIFSEIRPSPILRFIFYPQFGNNLDWRQWKLFAPFSQIHLAGLYF